MEANELHRTKKVSNMDGNAVAAAHKSAPVKNAAPAEPPEEVKGVKKVDHPKEVPNQKAKEETCPEKKTQQTQQKTTNANETPKEPVLEARRYEAPSKRHSGVSKRSGKSLHRSQPLLTLFGSNEPINPSSNLLIRNFDTNSEMETFSIMEESNMGFCEDYLYRSLALTRSKVRRHQTSINNLLSMALNYVRQHPYVVEGMECAREHVWKMLTYNKTATFFTGLAFTMLLIVFIVKHAAVFCLRLFLEVLLYAFIIDVMLC